MRSVLSIALCTALLATAVAPAMAQNKTRSIDPDAKSRQTTVARGSRTRMANAEAYSEGRGAWVLWQMEVERSNVGFRVYRVEPTGNILISDDLILGSAARAADQPLYGEEYQFFDVDGVPGSAYVIETIAESGKTVLTRSFSTAYVTDYRSVPAIARRGGQKKDPNVGQIADARLNMSKELSLEIESSMNTANIDAHRWVISQPGVRIGTKNEGLHRVSRATLEANGFDVDTDQSKWQLYLEGVEQAIIVHPSGDYIEFYAKALDTIESDTRMYFLINGDQTGRRMATKIARPSTRTVIAPTYDQTFVLKERTNYINTIRNGELENFWGRVISSTATTLNFNISGVDTAQESATIEVSFQGFSNGVHDVQLLLNGNALPSATGLGPTPYSVSQVVPIAFLNNGQNSLHMVAPTQGDTSLFDTVKIRYNRRHLSVGDRLQFHTQNDRNVTVEGFSTPNVRLFDITRDGDFAAMTNVSVTQGTGGFDLKVPAGRTRHYYAVGENGVHSPVSVSAYGTELLGSPTHGANMVVISYKGWMDEAEDWADYRRGQGVNVKVVNVDEIYDEFNFGVMKADALKSFLAYAHTNWQTKPQYVLLIGDATFDPKNYRGLGFFNFVPTRIINTIFTETGSDEFLADFNNDGLTEMAIGRIAARDAATVTHVLGKVQNWEENFVGDLSRGALFAYDRPDGYDFEGMSHRLRLRLPQSMPATFVFRDEPDAQAKLLAAMNAGKFVINYSGHGTAGAWAASNFFANSVVPQLNHPGNEAVFTMLTCLNGYFLGTNISLGENLLHATNGGSAASWASTGLTTPDIQEVMATRFYDRLGAGTIPRLGDLIRDAKTVIPGGTDVRLSWALLGDPMMRMH
ncbi:MAG: hypothetical protein H0V76_09310 [Blastocatellia bacterium]|nr:hypothetical protein [Blastocatellia bacterium]